MEEETNQHPEENHDAPQQMGQSAYSQPPVEEVTPQVQAAPQPTYSQPAPQVETVRMATPQAGVLSSEDKVFAALSYISVLFVVPLILRHEDQTVHFHAKQGLVLFGAEVVVWFLLFLLESFIAALSPSNTLGIVSALGGLAWLLFVATSLAAIYFIFRDKKWEIPFLAKLANRVSI